MILLRYYQIIALQLINLPLGANSETINCNYDFGVAGTLMFGDGVSTVQSNNPNGFGGMGMPSQVGTLILDAATTGNNRILKVVKQLTVKTRCEVISRNLFQR